MKELAAENLIQIKTLLEKITKNDFIKSHKILSGATIGQHVRHILEFYVILVKGVETGVVCYDKRDRDLLLETDKQEALNTIENLLLKLDLFNTDKTIKFEAQYQMDSKMSYSIQGSIYRELAYCVEHSIHHQAIIKSGLVALKRQQLVDNNFGVAYSTIKYRNSICVQ